MEDTISEKENIALFAFALTLPWTVLASLVEYYSNLYGKEYCVYLYFTYHCVALPILYFEEQIEYFAAAVYGPDYTFEERMWLAIGATALALFAAPYSGEFGLILLCALIGGCTWVYSRRSVFYTAPSLVKSHDLLFLGISLPIFLCAIYAVVVYEVLDGYTRGSVEVLYFAAAGSLLLCALFTVSKPSPPVQSV